MAVSEDIIATIGDLLGERVAREDFAAVFAALRARLPEIALLRCDAGDLLEEPYRRFAGVDLHLVDSRDHCTVMTSDPMRATGVLVALKVRS